MPQKTDLADYYAQRANEYERIYQKPERQKDLASLRKIFRHTLAGHDVFEIACGTGYWTQIISETAKSIIAADINEEVLQIARAKTFSCKVSFQKVDAFALPSVPQNKFSACLATAWWSHVQKSQIRHFLSQISRLLQSGALIVFMDNKFVPGSNTPISRTDDKGNTYQLRKLENGSEYEVLKNFPNENEVKDCLGDSATEIVWTELQYYWFLTCKLR